ncbi:DUF6302 family protein [Streptomyces sp. NBC_01768]|uniref:DUF6302 family protein n=1 Tax=Streptomyces sp. NBC_01768 TaxID=2975938 RepID=UPI003FA35292
MSSSGSGRPQRMSRWRASDVIRLAASPGEIPSSAQSASSDAAPRLVSDHSGVHAPEPFCVHQLAIPYSVVPLIRTDVAVQAYASRGHGQCIPVRCCAGRGDGVAAVAQQAQAQPRKTHGHVPRPKDCLRDGEMRGPSGHAGDGVGDVPAVSATRLPRSRPTVSTVSTRLGSVIDTLTGPCHGGEVGEPLGSVGQPARGQDASVPAEEVEQDAGGGPSATAAARPVSNAAQTSSRAVWRTGRCGCCAGIATHEGLAAQRPPRVDCPTSPVHATLSMRWRLSASFVPAVLRRRRLEQPERTPRMQQTSIPPVVAADETAVRGFRTRTELGALRDQPGFPRLRLGLSVHRDTCHTVNWGPRRPGPSRGQVTLPISGRAVNRPRCARSPALGAASERRCRGRTRGSARGLGRWRRRGR